MPEVQSQLNLTALSFLLKLPKYNKNGANRRKMTTRKRGSESSSTDSVNSGSGPDYQIVYRLDGPLGEGNV
jgi:hypothetical protein